jgi:hypothetical protein
MASRIYTYSFTIQLLQWFYKQKEIPTNPSDLRKKVIIMYLLIVPYWVFTLPGCFLEGTFCNLKRKNKIGKNVRYRMKDLLDFLEEQTKSGN